MQKMKKTFQKSVKKRRFGGFEKKKKKKTQKMAILTYKLLSMELYEGNGVKNL
jgi:hypothetical protein